jgi:hypothetical protein
MTIDIAHIGLLALLIHLIVRALKAGRFDRWLPARWRPLAALWLGAVACVLDAVVAGTPWQQAVLTALVAVAMAVLGHDTVIEAVRGGKEIGKKKK